MLVALGHGVFGFAETRAAAEAGATAFTHLGNGLPHQVPRQENPILAALYEEGLDATLIGDGHHLPDPLLDLIVRVKGPERCALVSDLAPAGGLAPGRHVIFGSEVELTEAGKLFNPATGYLAGSAQTLPDAATRLLGRGWPPGRIRTLARATPLRMLGLSGADLPAGGSLRLDPDAGFVPA
jgi:N-acetylglucosamine-6-phosphate deacetylase